MKCTNRISEKSLNFRLYRIIYEFPFHDAVYRRKDVKQMAELNKVSVDDLKVTGKRVLVRVDFNVPMKDGVITNDNRIQAALPTINKLVSEGAKVILCSHLGKPKNGPEEKFSLKAAAARLAELVSAKVTFVPSDVVVDDTVRTAVDKMQNGEIVVLEHRILQQGSGFYR